MEIEQALKWADTWGPVPSHPPNGDAQALMSLAAEVRRLRSENAMLRTGDTCARLCEGTAYRIELCRLKRDVLAVMPENWREDEEWARLIEAHRLTPNAGGEPTPACGRSDRP